MLDSPLKSKYIKHLTPIPTFLRKNGKLEEKVKSILFDIYGTLFISGSGDISTAKKKLEKTREIEDLLTRFKVKKKAETVFKDYFAAIEKEHANLRKKGVDFPEVNIDKIWMDVLDANIEMARKFAVEYELITNPVYPMPHLNELLSRCREKGIYTGIISNAQFYTSSLFDWFFETDLEGLGFDHDLIFFSYLSGYAKPSVFMFQAAADKLKETGISPGSALYLGNDMLNDIYPAKAVGFKTALFAGDARSLRLRKEKPKCKKISPDIVITDLLQLIEYI